MKTITVLIFVLTVICVITAQSKKNLYKFGIEFYYFHLYFILRKKSQIWVLEWIWFCLWYKNLSKGWTTKRWCLVCTLQCVQRCECVRGRLRIIRGGKCVLPKNCWRNNKIYENLHTWTAYIFFVGFLFHFYYNLILEKLIPNS